MKNARFLILIIIATFSLLTVQAYTSTPDTSKYNAAIQDGVTAKGASVQTDVFGQVIAVEEKADKPMWIREAKAIADEFSGYSIEIITVYNEPLAHSADLFQKFGGIMLDQRSADEFAYLIGQFEKATQADDYLAKVIKPQFPNAQIIKYESGQVVR